ncbi:MAG TPA: DUF5666 domain-containing protein [Solirubrobacteraceae bacterium]|nr:DUF5666 domain-containing protein [Solirubrobacteraceae bacterium]
MSVLLACAAGFYAGVRVEKAQLSTSTTALSGAGATSAGARFAARRGAGGLAALLAARGGAGSAGGLAGAGAVLGTVSSVDGRTLYVTEASGNTVRVRLTSATRISKTRPAGPSALRPGDRVLISGVTSGANVTAASVSDSGAGASTGALGALFGASGTGASTSTGSASGGSGGASPGVGSLFTPGG